MRSDFTTLRMARADAIATITLHRPEALNACNARLRAELARALAEVGGDPSVRALVLTGTGRAFSAGHDLTEVPEDPAAEVTQILDRDYNALVRTLRGLAIPTIAVVNGIAAGGGVGLALACDLVVAARSAQFIQVFARLGIAPDVGSSYFLPRLVGPARAAGLTPLGDPLDAQTAAEWGLIWKCVDDAVLMDEARALAQRLAAQARQGLALTSGPSPPRSPTTSTPSSTSNATSSMKP